MKFRFTYLAVIFLFSIGTAFTAQAQRGSSSPKFRSAYKRKFKPSWSVFGAPGIAVINSENTGYSTGTDEVGIVKNNGIGPAFNVGALYQFSQNLGIQGNIGYVGFKGTGDAVGNKYPEVDFKTSGVEASTSLIVNLISPYVGPTSRNLRLVVPYAKVGIGVLAYSSESEITDSGVKQPDATNYPDFTFFAPIGGGLKFQYSKQLSFAPELNLNLASTDYLDNTSYNYTGKLGLKKDAYLTGTVKVMYNLTFHRKSPFRIKRR
ncbi:outer membrane beta-barrel protein [Pontibacter fetidus]|uniref:Outer membrane beta-barrel protein n=1 Tax=Pontibacter fetidus TaxID=2700082 RepID=A0A6B2H4W3_9BACT|nr:outer membrane beta-barrel protein [Pontibacter fetidus]NDK57501.1 outer membrane beta-barrel protein [Pontibacter fetidus]